MSAVAPFGDCKKDPLNIVSYVQGHGAFIGIDYHTQIISVCSENVNEFLQKDTDSFLGESAVQVFGKEWIELAKLASHKGHHHVGEIKSASGKPLTVIGHRQGDYLILEIEQGSPKMPDWWNHSARSEFIDTLSSTKTIDECVQLIVNNIFTNTGLDRVMCYKFLPGWHGEVVAEVSQPGIDGFLGLRFPSSDVPATARKLYTINWHRMIADVDEKNYELTYWEDNPEPVDMSCAVLRAVHPVHVQYLRNMGVQASISYSLVINGKLWGLVACHNMTTISLGIYERLSLEEMAKMVSLHMKNLLGFLDLQRESALREKLSLVSGALQASEESPVTGITSNLIKFRDLFQADGAWLYLEGEDQMTGLTPGKKDASILRDWLDLLPKSKISHYHHLPESLLRHPGLVNHASGLLYIPLGTSDFLVLLRQEVKRKVNWAGEQAAQHASEGDNLTPRASFAMWQQEVSYSSHPWRDSDVLCANLLRKELTDYMSISRLEHVALHDSLTGLANRLQFEHRLQEQVSVALKQNSQFAIHMIDLDRFKAVNDSLGHAAGDVLLKQASSRLQNLVRAKDTVARLGGDEFAIIQAGVSNREAASKLADRIVSDIGDPFEVLGYKIDIGASVGVALFPGDSTDEQELLKHADAALYAVKKAGRNAFSLFTPNMTVDYEYHLDDFDIAKAFDDNEFELYYQPVINARSGRLEGLESYVRWQHPTNGLLVAEQFLPLIKKLHLGTKLDDWVLDKVFSQHKQWMNEELPSIPITVNIDTNKFSSRDLLKQLTDRAEFHDVGWEWLRLDIKEDDILRDINHSTRKIVDLRKGGVATQLDNFGRGFVSLGFSKSLPIIAMKFDAVALPLGEDENISMTVLSIVKGVAKVHNTRLIITRIETQDEIEWMRRNGVELIQGNAVSAPLSAQDAKKLLAKHMNETN